MSLLSALYLYPCYFLDPTVFLLETLGLEKVLLSGQAGDDLEGLPICSQPSPERTADDRYQAVGDGIVRLVETKHSDVGQYEEGVSALLGQEGQPVFAGGDLQVT